jgi:hypothetical protein
MSRRRRSADTMRVWHTAIRSEKARPALRRTRHNVTALISPRVSMVMKSQPWILNSPHAAAAQRRNDGALLHIVCEHFHTHGDAADQVTTTLCPVRGRTSADDIGGPPGTQRVASTRLDNDTTKCIEVNSRLRGTSPLAERCHD